MLTDTPRGLQIYPSVMVLLRQKDLQQTSDDRLCGDLFVSSLLTVSGKQKRSMV